jgi:hypothetical protein
MTTLVREFPNPVFQCVSLIENRPRQSKLTLTVVCRIYDHLWTLSLVNPRPIMPEGTSIDDARQRLLEQEWRMSTILKNENQGKVSFAFTCENKVGEVRALSIHASGYEEHEDR